MEQIESFIRHWRRALIFMLLGGIAGWVLWMFLPREYTAVTRLTTGIDYNRTGTLDDMAEDRLLGIAEDIIHSDAVMKKVFQRSGFSDYDAFFKMTGTNRTNDTWSLSVTGKDPKEIGELSLFWLNTAYGSLQEAKEHAIKAEALQNELEGMTLCIRDRSQGALSSGCPDDPDEIMQNIDTYSRLIQNELSVSCGLSSALQIGSIDQDQLEIRSASRSAAADTIFGALTGLLIAFAIVWFSKNEI